MRNIFYTMLRSRQKWSKHFAGRCPNILTVLLIYRPQQHVFFSRFVCPWKFRNRRSLYYKCKDFLTEINWNEVGKILLRFWQKKMLDFCPWRTIYPLKERRFLWSDIFETAWTILTGKSEDLSERYPFRIEQFNDCTNKTHPIDIKWSF